MRVKWIATVTAGLALMLGACGDSEESASPVTETSPGAAEGRPADPAGPRPPTGEGDGDVELDEVGSFEAPVYVTQPPRGDDHLYVVEQCGQVQRVPLDGGEATVFLDVADEIVCGGEQGLLSIAFPPDADRSGLFYVYFTDTEGTTRIVEYQRSKDDPAVADPDSARELLAIEDFAENHNGGLLKFGPGGALYAGTGDGGGAGDPERTAQDPNSLLGKLLRIDTKTGDTEIAALGLRNPWRYSFDRERGDLWIGDVGQDEVEEIDSARAAELDGELNFGWSAYEGTRPFNSDQEAPGALDPSFEYGRDGGCSVTGGYVVRDRELRSLYGRYLFGDYCEGELRSFTAAAGEPATDERELGVEVPQLSSFGEDAAGRVYAVSLEGPVYRLVPAG